MKNLTINAGPLTSYSSLSYYLGPKLKELRENYLSGITPNLLLDLSSLEYGKMNISALIALLAICKKVRDFIGYPIPTMIRWDPKVQGFLSDIDFFKTSDQLDLFKWQPEGIIGGYKRGNINPNTKILFYRDIRPIKDLNNDLIGIEKAKLKQKIAPHFLMKCSNLFTNMEEEIEDRVSNTTLELIANSLMHAEDIAFVGLQRSNKRITVAVCDGGIGFAKSLPRTYPTIDMFKNLSHVEGIVIGSLIQQNQHGLRLAINEVLNFDEYDRNFEINEGYVTISSFDSEIRWQKYNWLKALNYFENFDTRNSVLDCEDFLGISVSEYLSKEELNRGYWKKYDNILIGTRITFEINLKNRYA